MKRDTLKSLYNIATAASNEAKTDAKAKITAVTPIVAPNAPKAAQEDATRTRLNLYLGVEDLEILKEIRKALVIGADGVAVSDNAAVRTALRAVDMSKVVEAGKVVLAADGRRKG